MLDKFFYNDNFSITPTINKFSNERDGSVVMSVTGYTTASGECVPAYVDYRSDVLGLRVYSSFSGLDVARGAQSRFNVNGACKRVMMMASDLLDDGYGAYAAFVSNESGLRGVLKDFGTLKGLLDSGNITLA